MAQEKKQHVVVVGLGDSGEAACAYFLRRGARVTATDVRPEADIAAAEALRRAGAALECGGHKETTFLCADLIVASPGVPLTIPAIRAARAKGIPVTSEFELAAREAKADILALTGTNGKSTTVSLLHHILSANGQGSVLAGNIGYPFLRAVEENPTAQCFVVEASSYQLETAEKFHARAACVLNVTPDHLDRYASLDDYAAAKARVFMNQTADDLAVLNADEPRQRAWASRLLGGIAARKEWLTMEERMSDGGCQMTDESRLSDIRHPTSDIRPSAFVMGDEIFLAEGGGAEERLLALGETRLMGRHNLQNIMAAALMARSRGLSAKEIRAHALTFRGLPHVMEFVDDIAGVSFYDNSKATNVDAAVKSLEAFEGRRAAIILGGRDKGGDYAPLKEALARKAKRAVLIGENKDIMRRALNGAAYEILECGSLEEAVVRGAAGLSHGDVVLLAPAASSFDMFRNYKERGEAFARAVRRLREGVKP